MDGVQGANAPSQARGNGIAAVLPGLYLRLLAAMPLSLFAPVFSMADAAAAEWTKLKDALRASLNPLVVQAPR